MTEPWKELFLRTFDDSGYPAGFLEDWEALECLSSSEQGETLLVRSRKDGRKGVAKCAGGSKGGCAGRSSLLRGLKHPGLPEFLAEYEQGDMVCSVRAFVEGEPLNAPGLRDRLDFQAVADIGIQLCDILQYLHSRNPPIIHRDIKPSNLILRPEGRVILIDFGISRSYRPGAQEDTVSFGTRRFAPPEQYGFQQTDERSDLYSLGAVLCYLLTGDARPGEETAPGYKPLMKVISRCMAFSPQQRYGGAGQVKRALTDCLPRKRKLRKTLWAAASLAVLGMLILGVLAAARLKALGENPGKYPGLDFASAVFTRDKEYASIGQLREILIRGYGLEEAYVRARPELEERPGENPDSFFPWPLEEEEENSAGLTAYAALKLYWPEALTLHAGDTRAGDNGVYPPVNGAMEFFIDQGILPEDAEYGDPITGREMTELFQSADGLWREQNAAAQEEEAEQTPGPDGFYEPLIGEAVRVMLGKSDGEAVTREELEGITELYIFAQVCARNQEEFYAAAQSWYAADGPRGSIRSLKDLSRMPNLKRIYLGGQLISDLTPLDELEALETLELRNNAVTDISPLTDMILLSQVGLNGNPVKDLSPLKSCPSLKILDLCDASAYDPAVLEELGDFQFLDISNATDSYRYLRGKTIQVLKAGHSGMDTLKWIEEVEGLKELEINDTRIQSLRGLEEHQELTYLRMTQLTPADCQVLTLLPRLETVEADGAMLSTLSPLAREAGFQLDTY